MGFSLKNLFENLELDTGYSNSDKPVEVQTYPTVHHEDWEAVSLVDPQLETGPWIAGGAALRWYQDLSVGSNDIDVFCKNAVQAQQTIERIKSYGRYSVKFQSDNAVTIEYWNKDTTHGVDNKTIQVITRRYFGSLKEVIDSFDITVCEIGTCGNEWELGPFTARDIREKNLRFKLPVQSDAPKRLTKYWTYGYRPVPGTLEAIQENPTTRWAYSSNEDYNNAF
jgi:hypothetical protein